MDPPPFYGFCIFFKNFEYACFFERFSKLLVSFSEVGETKVSLKLFEKFFFLKFSKTFKRILKGLAKAFTISFNESI